MCDPCIFFIATYVVTRKALTGFKPDLCDAGAVPFHAIELSGQLGAGRYYICSDKKTTSRGSPAVQIHGLHVSCIDTVVDLGILTTASLIQIWSFQVEDSKSIWSRF